jgi:hypothetical protein
VDVPYWRSSIFIRFRKRNFGLVPGAAQPQ